MKHFARRYRASKAIQASKLKDTENGSETRNQDDHDSFEVEYQPKVVGPDAGSETGEEQEGELVLYYLLQRINPLLCDLHFDLNPKKMIGKTCVVVESAEIQDLYSSLDRMETEIQTLHKACSKWAESQRKYLDDHKEFVDQLWPFVARKDSPPFPVTVEPESLERRMSAALSSQDQDDKKEDVSSTLGGDGGATPAWEDDSGFGGACETTTVNPEEEASENFQSVCNKLINMYTAGLVQQQQAHQGFVKKVETVLSGCIANEIATARLIEKDFVKSKAKLDDSLSRFFNVAFKLVKKSSGDENLSFAAKVHLLYSRKLTGLSDHPKSKFEILQREIADVGAHFLNVLRHFKGIVEIIQNKLDKEIAHHVLQFVEKQSVSHVK